MSKRFRIILIILFLIMLYALSCNLNLTYGIPSGDAAIWFHAGLLMLVLGSYWIEHYFTRPTDVVLNGLIVFISVSTLSDPPYPDWWESLRWIGFAITVLAFSVVWSGSPALTKYDTSKTKRITYLILIRIGSAKVLFSLVFGLALISYIDLARPIARWMVLFWLIVLVFKQLEIESFIASIFSSRRPKSRMVIGPVSRIFEPNIVRFTLNEETRCAPGALVALTNSGRVTESCPLGIVICHRKTATEVEGEALLLDRATRQESACTPQTVVKVDPSDDIVSTRLNASRSLASANRLVGFASKGSEISRLLFEVTTNDTRLEEGHLVSVGNCDDINCLYQIINAKLAEEPSLGKGERTYTTGEAHQLGTWDSESQGFETYGWVAPENAPVMRLDSDTKPDHLIKPGLLDVGSVPNSSFLVNIRLRDLVLYHSAILGVTGSGKSFLAYELIENCARSGIKVVCLDATGDHKRYIRNPVLLDRPGALKDFLQSPSHDIGIIEFENEKIHPVRATEVSAQIVLDWCRDSRQVADIKEPNPKALLVLEEAHQLVPEWNFNPQKDLQEVVNKTSQIVLQARKYGLGFMVITQRTANVTKSILNQCNTIFAFQAYDETGFDFMKNYMGLHYVQALPNLKKRQGVLVGKASVSDRPIIVRFHDQDRTANADNVPTMPKIVDNQAGAEPNDAAD